MLCSRGWIFRIDGGSWNLEFRILNLGKGMIDTKITTFTDLEVWQEGHKLVLMIYQETKSFPKEEIYGLISQLRRSSVSVTSNIAEGFGRYSYQEKLRFYYMAHGSLTELQNQLLIARDVGYLSQERFQKIAAQTISAHKLLNAFISSTKQLVQNSIPNSKF